MTRQLVQYELESGGTIVVSSESESLAGAPVTRGLRDVEGEIVERASESFESALAQVEPAAQSLVARFRDLPHGPQTITVEFGVTLHAKMGAIIAETSGDANFKVSLTWHHDAQPSSRNA
jgi:NTP-dependent ternary system trypsin peptidase co-occuring protein